MADGKRYWTGFQGRVHIPDNIAASHAFEQIDGFLRTAFSDRGEQSNRVPRRSDIFERANIVASGEVSSTLPTYLFHSLTPAASPMAGWYDAGEALLDTGFNDPGQDLLAARASAYIGRAQVTAVHQTGTVGAARDVRWLLSAEPMLGCAPNMPAAAGSTQVPDLTSRVYLRLRCLCSEQADGVNPTDLQVFGYRWALIRAL